MAATLFSTKRALHRPRRLDARALVGVFLTLTALGGSALTWTQTTAGRPVLVATRSLPVGATLAKDDLRAVAVRADDDVYTSLVPASAESTVVGKVLRQPVQRNAPLTFGAVSAPTPLTPSQMEITIPVTPETALDGQVQRGDTVAVLMTAGKGTPQTHTSILIDRALVREVGHNQPSTALTASSGNSAHTNITSLTLLVTRQEAIDLATARWNDEIDVALVGPAGAPAAAPASGVAQ